jgi:hypothetical protein
LVGVHRVGGLQRQLGVVVALEELSDGDGIVDVDALGTEADAPLDGVEDETSVVVPFGMKDEVAVPEGVVVSVDVSKVSEVVGTVDVEASGAAEGMLEAVLLASELFNVGAVEVEFTKGGAFSIYKPLGCTA